MRYSVILNPAAGKGRLHARAMALLTRLERDGRLLRIDQTQGDGHATELAAQAVARGDRALLVAGGDGTLQQVVQGAMRARGEEPVHLAVLPLGTGNSFLREFSAHNFDVAHASLLAGRETPCDVVAIEHSEGTLYSINIVSFGFTSEVGALTNARFKWLGTAGYVAAVVTSLATLRSQTTRWRLDGGPEEAIEHTFVAACNSRFTGGAMMMAPAASINDGHMSIVIAKRMSRMRLLRTFPQIFRGEHVHDARVETREAARMELLDAPRCNFMVDGEIVSLEARALHVIRQPLRIVRPQGTVRPQGIVRPQDPA